MTEQKDGWDKAEIIAKFVIPVVVAATAYLLNGQISERQANTERSRIAIEILSAPLAEEQEGVSEDPLRRWALDVLSKDFEFSSTERALLLTGERSLPGRPLTITELCADWEDDGSGLGLCPAVLGGHTLPGRPVPNEIVTPENLAD